MKTKINVLVDWGKSFVDTNGSFYCGTTEDQKERAARILPSADLVVYLSDVHTRTSSEFQVNGGLYPAHNLIADHQFNLQELGIENTDPPKTVSPQLTEKLHAYVRDKKSGLVVPRHVFFQDYNADPAPKPAFTLDQVAKTFAVDPLDERAFLEGGIEYVVNAKHMFNGVGLQATEFMGEVPGVPKYEKNIFSLLKQKYGQGAELEFDFTGVVMGICIYQSASGAKQIFPKATVNVIADACTHLVYAPLGIADEDTGNLVAKKMCQQVGVNYLTTAEFLGGASR